MKKGISFSEDQQNELVLNLLTDAVIFERAADAIFLLQKAANPAAPHWDAENHNNGIVNAYRLLGVPFDPTFEQEEVTDFLHKIFLTTLKNEERRGADNQRHASEIAETILYEWKAYLKTTNLEMKKAS